MNSVNSHFIVGYKDSYIQGTKVFIVMEYCQKGDLFTYKEKNKKPFVDNVIWKNFIHICMGLFHLHSKGIVHRDLKTLNIFLTKEGVAKIGDFGEARKIIEESEWTPETREF